MNKPDDPHPHWLVPQWPVPASVWALCTTRAGGASDTPYDSLNLGSHVGDDPVRVQANRRRLASAMGCRPVFLEQVHGIAVAAIDGTTPDGLQADGCVARGPGAACTIMVADCLPVLFALGDGSAVAAAHAGWRGLAGGVLEASVHALAGAQRREGEVVAWLGPCIGAAAFEVGGEVVDAFVRRDPQAMSAFAQTDHTGKWLGDLQALARQRLARLGIASVHGNDGGAAWCTVSNPQRFHSFRRDQAVLGGSGRMAATVWIA